MEGLTFLYNRSGGISFIKTLLKNNLWKLWKDIRSLPVDDYDLVLNDFEFTSAWACRLKKKSCTGLGHQASFFSQNVPRPKRKELLGEFILRWYAPCQKAIGFHFKAYDKGIYTPVIRSEVRELRIVNNEHYTVYLPAFSDEVLIQVLQKFKNTRWQVFSKSAETEYQKGQIRIQPIENQAFLKSLASCEGFLSSAGFEGPAEALFLQKKVCVLAIRHQYEQYCNAAALSDLGVSVLSSIRDYSSIQKFLDSKDFPQVDFPNQTEVCLKKLVEAEWQC
jgi:uncharacterized protein (TIGR00661 family)